MNEPDLLLRPPPLSLYLHFPWCVRKCPYCDFNSHQQNGQLPEREYVDALIRDLELDLPAVWGRSLYSVFMGGGTPSLFSPEQMNRLLSEVRARLPIRPDAEITMEANPGTLEYAPMDEYRDAGINRLSVGIQSFDDDLLSRIGRIHSAAEASSAVRKAMAGGFDRINIDLMYALPGQSLEQACDDVQQALDLGVDHLSHYQLTIEPNTLFHARPPVLPADDDAWTIQQRCQEMIEQAGLNQYEVSAWARDGQRCQHNVNYWQFGDYLGIGAGAHGKLTSGSSQQVVRTTRQKHPAAYLEAAGREQAVIERRTLAKSDLRFEYMLNAMRMNEGFEIEHYQQVTGLRLDADQAPWPSLWTDGLIEQAGSWIRPSARGRQYLNEITERFLD